jgi:hypothetical protein
MTNPSKLMAVAVLLACCRFAAAGETDCLVPPELLKAAGLKMVWQNRLPMKEGENLADLHLLGGRVYAFSGMNYMVGLKKTDGGVVFSRQAAAPGLPIFGLGLHDERLLSIVGNQLVEFNPDTGAELARLRLGFGVGRPAVRNSGFYYVAGTDRRVHVLRSSDRVKLFDVAAANDSEVVCVLADDDSMVFATAAGNVISVEPDQPVRQWQFDASGAVVGAVVKRGGGVFFSSQDTNVYKVDAATGKLAWKYQTDAMLRSSCRVTDGVVYQNVYGKGFVALSADSGRLLWRIATSADLLAEAGRRAYLTDGKGLLIVMDNVGGRKLYEVNFARVSTYVVNTTDSRIYIGGGGGRIACLEPVE